MFRLSGENESINTSMSGKQDTVSTFWFSMTTFAILNSRLKLPPDLQQLLKMHDAGLFIPMSYVQFLDAVARDSVYKKSNALVLDFLLRDEEVGKLLSFVLAVFIETIGAHVFLRIDPRFYLLALCVSRRCLVPQAHFDLNWALCFAHGTIAGEPYPIPLVRLRTLLQALERKYEVASTRLPRHARKCTAALEPNALER